MDALVTQYETQIAYAVGYDLTDAASKAFLDAVIDAGIADMKATGVSDTVMGSHPLVLATLIIFVTDNLNMTPGEFKSSPLYNSNTTKLRWISTT